MTTTITSRFERLDRWWLLGASLVAFAATNAAIMRQVGRFEDAGGAALGLLETPDKVGEDLYEVAASYPTAALEIYRDAVQPADILFPVAAGLFFAVALAMLSIRVWPGDSPWRRLPLLGPVATACDWLENLGVAVVLRTTDDPIAPVEVLTTVALVAKFATGAVAGLAIVVLGGVLLVRRIRR